MNTNQLSTINNITLPGVSLRAFRGESDYPVILDILQTSCRADGVERADTLVDVVRNYSHLHNCDPYTDMLFAEMDGQPAAYVRCWYEIDGAGNFSGFTIGWVKPAFRGKGIGTLLLRFGENRLEQISAGLVSSGQLAASASRYIDVEWNEKEKDKDILLRKQGYQPVRYGLSMVRPNLENIPDLPLPPGLEVRPVLSEHLWPIYEASNEAFRDHWGYIPEPEEDQAKLLEDPSFDPSLWRIAWAGDQVAGMVRSFINQQENETYQRRRGYTEGICVRRPWRKLGVASTLIALSLTALKERGMTEAALGVDSQNLSGALQLYERMGFRRIGTSGLYRKNLD